MRSQNQSAAETISYLGSIPACIQSLISLLTLILAASTSAFGQVTINVDAPSTVQLGMGLRYVVQVTNTGVTAASGLVITDTLPSGLSANSLTANCAGTSTVICDIGSLGAGQTSSVAIEVVPVSAPAVLSNTAMVTGGASSTVSTNVINNGVVLSILAYSSDSADYVTSNPGGVNCAPIADVKHLCYAFFPPGTVVTLTANGPNFAGWIIKGSGTCPGTGTCTLTMSQEQQVTAAYNSPVAFAVSSATANGALEFPFAVDLSRAVIGGVTPYTYSIKSGSLPPGLTLTGSVISGVPTAAGTFNAVAQVEDSTSPTPLTSTINLTGNIFAAPNTQPTLLNGPYALLFRGVTDAPDASERAMVGSLTFDGAGNVRGTVDSNCNDVSCGGVQTQVAVSGTYTIGPDNRGLITLNDGSMIFAIAVGNVSGGVASAAQIIRFDDITGLGTRGAGELRQQNTAAFTTSSIAGSYAFGVTGEDPAYNRAVEAGLVSLDNANDITSGGSDINDNGTLSAPTFAGTYSTPSGAGRITLTLNYVGGGSSSIVAYIIDANTLFMMTLDPGTAKLVLAGSVQRQAAPEAFANSSLAGPDVIDLEGLSGAVDSSNSEVFLGLLSATSGTASITFDSDNDKIVQIQGTESGPYSVAANGRAVLNTSVNPLIAYFWGQDQAYVMASTADPGFGEINLQQGGPFSIASFQGDYVLGDREPASPSGGPVTSGSSSLSACTLSTVLDQGHESGRLDYDIFGSTGYAVSSAGRVSTTFSETETIGTGNLVGYLVSPSRVFIADVDPSSHHPHIVELLPASLAANPVLVSIAVTPGTPTLGVGQTQQFTAMGTYSDQSTQDLTAKVTWVSSDLGSLSVNATGLGTAVGIGEADVLATLGCISSAAVPVTLTAPVLQQITVSPANASVAAGLTQPFMATGTYSDNSTQNLTTTVTWSTSNPATATISNGGGTQGVAKGVSQGGPVTISAAQAGITGTAQLTVTAPLLESISISVTSGSIMAGLTDAFTATGTYSDNSTQNLTTAVSWSSSNTTIATISNTPGTQGVATGLSPGGPITITATLAGVSGVAQLTVTPATGLVKVVKTLNGSAIPATSCGTASNLINPCAFTFQLRSGAFVATSGTILESEIANNGNGGVISFVTVLSAGQPYQMCEQLMPGWTTTLGSPIYSVFNPSGDNSIVCTGFVPAAAQTTTFSINNLPPPSGLAMGAGFWKNWASCAASNGKQQPVLDRTLASFPGGGVYVGDLFVNTCQMAVNILNKSTNNGTKAASSPAFNLAAQLLAADLNLQAGAGSNGCVASDMVWANDLLSPIRDNLGKSGIDFAKAFNNNIANPTLLSNEATDANYLETQLNSYNNDQPAQCSTTYQF